MSRTSSAARHHPLPQAARAFRGACTAVLIASLGVLGACQTAQQRVEQHEDHLAAAGFLVKPANTPERQGMLNRLPPHKFVREVNGDDVNYVYADPLVCDCLYVGTQQAYNTYKRDQLQRKLADEQQMTAQMYNDAAWNWGAWGPWGPGYGIGYGRIGW